MPTSHFAAVLAALRGSWFFTDSVSRSTAAEQGRAYASRLEQAFNPRADKEAIESALGLGFYAVHTQANEQKRLALRAVLAAEMLIKNRRPADIPALRRPYECLPLDALKRAFVHLFPVGQADSNREKWAPNNFTDPSQLPALKNREDWTGRSVPPYMFLVHMNANPATSAVWQEPDRFDRYSASSLTLMSNKKPFTYPGPGQTQGLILRVPENNILVTHYTDLMSQLHLESIAKEKTGRSLAEEILELISATGGRLEAPETVLNMTNSGTPTVGMSSKYNEVVVCGKPGVQLPWGVTEKVQVVGMFMLVTKDGKLLIGGEERLQAMRIHCKNLPLLFLPNEAVAEGRPRMNGVVLPRN